MNLTINRKVWWRGVNHATLLHKGSPGETCKRSQCCVGIYLTALGVPDDVLLGKGGAQQLSKQDLPSEASWLVLEEPTYPLPLKATMEAGSLYDLNDTPGIPAELREEQIKEQFARQGVTVTFED